MASVPRLTLNALRWSSHPTTTVSNPAAIPAIDASRNSVGPKPQNDVYVHEYPDGGGLQRVLTVQAVLSA